MATVTGFTAERMQEIEDSTVVDGEIDVNGDLQLLTRDGTPINAGHVVGPTGPAGPNGGIADAPINGNYYLRKDGAWVVAPVLPGQLIGYKNYNPAASVEVTCGATFVDADATNLVVAFVVPPSGKVFVKLNGVVFNSTASAVMRWGLREATTDLPNPCRVYTGGSVNWIRVQASILVEGLTPGAAKSYKWSHYASAGTGGLGYGQASPAFHGPAVMEVWAA